MLVFVLGGIAFLFRSFIYAPGAVAQVATFYPNTCLGGWKNPAHAEGAPEVSSDDPDAYTDDNAATLEGALSQIYCGEYVGELPIDTTHTRIALKFSWSAPQNYAVLESESVESDMSTDASSVRDNAIVGEEESHGDGSGGGMTNDANNVSSSSDSLLEEDEATSTDNTLEPSDESSEGAEGIEEVVTDTNQAALEVTESSDDVVPEPDPEETIGEPKPTSDEPITQFVPELLPMVYAATTTALEVEEMKLSEEESVVGVTEATSSPTTVFEPTSVESSLPNTDAWFEIRYTLDGTEWNSLGFVSGVSNAMTFDLPIEEFATIDDIRRVQVAVVSVPTLDSLPKVYLDALWLEVSYIPAEGVETYRELSEIPTAYDFTDVVLDTHASGSPAFLFGTFASGSIPWRVNVEEIASVRGIDNTRVLMQSRSGEGQYTVIVFDMAEQRALRLTSDAVPGSAYPSSSKDGVVYWISPDGDRVFSYNLENNMMFESVIVAHPLSEDINTRLQFPTTPWTVVIGSDSFYFYSDQTGEIFADEHGGGLARFLNHFAIMTNIGSPYLESFGLSSP